MPRASGGLLTASDLGFKLQVWSPRNNELLRTIFPHKLQTRLAMHTVHTGAVLTEFGNAYTAYTRTASVLEFLPSVVATSSSCAD